MPTINFIVFPNQAEADSENSILKAIYGYPDPARGTYEYFNATPDYLGIDARVIVVDAGFPMGYRPDLPRMTEAELRADGFTFAPRIGA